jgi:pilus assembly protein CpaE
MSAAVLAKSRLLVIGAVLADHARQALPQTSIEGAGLEMLDALTIRRAAPDAILIDAEAGDTGRLLQLIEAIGQLPAAPAVLLAGAQFHGGLARALFKLARADVLEAPFTSEDLTQAISALLAPGAPAGQPRSQCWSVMSAVGGAGATTLAIEMATRLALCAPRAMVGLIDLNLADGAAAGYLGGKAAMTLTEAAVAPDRMDASLLAAFAARVTGGFDLFAGPRDPTAFERHHSVAVCRLLEVACQTYDWLVVDMPRARHGWSLDVLAGSDEVLIVSELTVPALLAARALADEIEAELGEDSRPKIVLNRLAKRAFGPSPSQAEAEKALGRKVDGAITSDWEAAACSVNLGGPISHHRPRSRIVRDVAMLVDGLALKRSAPAAAEAPAKPKRRLLG